MPGPSIGDSEWIRKGAPEVETLRMLLGQVVYARPSAAEEDAKAALEWIASRDGKTLVCVKLK